MILRKPYAILIKNFKIIHLIMAILTGYLFYKTNNILSFLNEYLSSTATTISNEVTTSLFGSLFVASSIAIIIASLIILFLLYIKEKPVKFYIYNIIIYIAILVYYYISYNIIKSLEVGLVDVRTLKLLHDFALVSLLLEGLSFIFVIIRATGFDIKSFNFKKDLEELNIESKDNEEFEVEMEFDTNKLKRNFNKKIRHFKYAYVENKLLINILVAIILIVIAIITYINVSVTNRSYKMGESFKTNQFIFSFKNSYVTKYNYQNTIIKDGYELVIIKMDVKTISSTNKLNTGRFYLEIDNNKYHHNSSYKDSVIDIGSAYISQSLSTSFSTYLLIFEIPVKLENKTMTLKYTDTDKNIISIDVTPTNLNEKKEVKNISIPEEMTLEDSILNNSKFIIYNYEIAPSFKLDYNYCTNDTCTDSYEYLRTSTGDNYLLKLNGTINLEEDNSKINTLFKFISFFGKLKYEINGVVKTMNTTFKEVKSKKVVTNDIYIEVNEEIYNADKIYLEFNIRNKIYVYNIK